MSCTLGPSIITVSNHFTRVSLITCTYCMKKLDIKHPITESNEVKYLGILFDSSLKFTKQIGTLHNYENE